MKALCWSHDLLIAAAQGPHSPGPHVGGMTEQQTLDQPPPSPPPPAPPAGPPPQSSGSRRAVGVRVLIAATVGAFVVGTLVGGGFGALIGYVAHPDGPADRPGFQQMQQDAPQRPDLGPGGVQPPSTS